MTPLRLQLRGLMFKLALFYMLLSLPTLILVESTILIFEFQEFMAGVESGRLAHASERGAAELAGYWGEGTVESRNALNTWVESWMLRLERPREGLSVEDSYVLLELSADPLAAAVLAPDGTPLAQAPTDAGWQPQLPRSDEAGFADALGGTRAVTLSGEDSPFKIRRVLAPVRAADGRLLGLLFVELRLPLPWRKFLLELSFEWPIVIGYLIVFGLASSFFLSAWVTRRLNRIARAATAWSRGDFSSRIGDTSHDELGRVSSLLDRMALDLKSLLRSRAQLATLAERQRLARDLHDTVKQKAFALNLQLATARRVLADAPGAERLEQAQRLTQQIQQELAQILDEMRASDAELPFDERVRTRANDWAHTSGMALDFDLDDVPPLPAAHEESLLRILDEALSNVLRHSGAQRVELQLRREADRVRLAIADNGRGTPDETGLGMGLRNMRERAQALPAGRFEFDALPGRGSRVTVSFLVAEAPIS
ncbi:MAG: sensor histidine kinase [Dokdonella sp.]